jgi:hypothetical protein
MKMHKGRVGITHILDLDIKWNWPSISGSGHLIPWEKTPLLSTQWDIRQGGPRSRFGYSCEWQRGKFLPLQGIEPRASSPQCSESKVVLDRMYWLCPSSSSLLIFQPCYEYGKIWGKLFIQYVLTSMGYGRISPTSWTALNCEAQRHRTPVAMFAFLGE